MANDAVSVSLVNDYEIIVHGLRRMLEPFTDRVRVVETEAGGLPESAADVVLFDTFASRRASLARVEEIAADDTSGRLALYTWDVPSAFAADIDAACVDGVILKSQRGEELVTAIERIAAGESVGESLLTGDDGDEVELTERELEVLALLGRGLSNPQIARELYLSPETVKSHVRSLFRKLEVDNRTQAALTAGRFGVAPPTPLGAGAR